MKVELPSGNEMHVWEGNGLVGHYPTDPTKPIADIMAAVTTKNMKQLISGVYNLTGYALYLAFGPDPEDGVPLKTMDLRALAQPIFDHIGANPQSVPPWLLPLLIHVLQDIQTGLEKKQVVNEPPHSVEARFQCN